MALHLVLLVVLFASVLSIESHDLVSDAEALHHIISDLHGQRSAPAIDHPCSTTGVTCDAVAGVTRLSMGSHKLEGSISPAIGGLSRLRELSLPDNLLSGGLPRELAGCRALEILVLRDNRLSGDLPDELSSLLSLRILDLSYNRLTGDVSFLYSLQNLETLSLADNLFSGRVPSFHNLITIDVAGNPDLISEHPNSLRRSLASRRNPNNNKTAAAAAAAEGFAPAPSPSSAPLHRPRHTRRKIRNAAIGFVVGLLSGIASAVVLSLLFRMLVNCVKGRYRGIANAGPTIFSPLIKSAEELAFLEKEDGLASLELIGRGGCGEVYKAQLPGEPGKLVAVKRILRVSTDGREPTDEESQLLDKWMRQVRSEIVTVGHIRHRNLLPLLAHLSRPDCHYLVYEFMKNGSLHDVLDQNRELDWLARHKIATGIASGLEYLHHNHNPHIVHRDLKPGNVLLDDDMEARIADFGLAKELPDANTHMTASNVAGTMGYIAPEYHQTLKLTPKCDVYSLGVILGVLVTGMMPSHEFFQGTSEMSLVKWLRNVMGSPSPGDAIDAKMRGQGFDEQVLLVARIAIFCTADEPKDRPTSKDVRAMLSQIKH